ARRPVAACRPHPRRGDPGRRPAAGARLSRPLPGGGAGRNATQERQCLMPATDRYDYVIVGAGSAGCVLTNRLSADPAVKVLVIEAGPKDTGWKIHMPAALAHPLANDKFNWFYRSEPEPGLDGRRMYCPRGRVLGGSSSINGMIYIRGHARDYDRWAQMGLRGWSYADCLPYFRKAQTHELGAAP